MDKLIVHIDEQKGLIHPELHGQFIEFLGSCIYDGIWVGENSEIPNYDGLRKDVVDGLKELAPPIIRWPGGCYADTYHWRSGIGKREERPVTYNENFGTFEIDTNQFGTHEFMKLCQMVEAKPWLNINMLSGSVAEMREWMEYCNRSEATALAKEREANGTKEPFGVEYWGIGNEVWAGGGTMTAEAYGSEYRKYATAFPSFATVETMFDHQPFMKRIASGPDGNKPKERVAWTRDFFGELSKYRQPIVDAYDLHFYNWNVKNIGISETEFDETQWYEVINSCFELEEVIKEQYELIQEGLKGYPAEEGFFKGAEAKCELIVGEWGNWHAAAFTNRPALYQQCTMRDAITTALTLDIFHRNSDLVRMACLAQTVNVLNSLFLTEGSKCLRTPNYDVFLMYRAHQGGRGLEIEQKNSGDENEVYAFASKKEEVILVNLVNTNMKLQKIMEIDFGAEVEFLDAEVLAGDMPNAYNSFEQPDRIRKKKAKAPEQNGSINKLILPATSVSVYRFKKKADA
ncbi:MAG TPA: alpha-L-arabinofuranosidase C-terminal domain-containing protein [Mobilitalea sp.]|nr:alpha-L-arabinofuranosidase C-terminal domain-containing protein [Mobilitalea sp.]